MRCNLCGSEEFIDFNGREKVRCPQCSSLERSRMLWLYMEHSGCLRPDARVLHVAPERCIYEHVLAAGVQSANYHVHDFNPENYEFAKGITRLNLCDLEHLPSDFYDLIIDSHVLEHVMCNVAHPLYHLHRALKPDGIHFLILPFLSGKYDECFQDIGDEERFRRFRQNDHVRRFGVEDIPRHLGCLMRLPERYDARDLFSEAQLREANIPAYCWQTFNPSAVLQLRKYDMRLLPEPKADAHAAREGGDRPSGLNPAEQAPRRRWRLFS